MSTPKRFLILTEKMGLGHLSAAKAIASALTELYGDQCVVEIANPIDDQRVPSMLRQSQDVYDLAVREVPDLYKFSYEISDTAISSSLIGGAMTILFREVLKNLIKTFQPDAIVTTRENYLVPLQSLFTPNMLFPSDKRRIPIITTVTDLTTVHRLWFNPISDLVLVPTQIAYELALSSGLSAERVKITGVPVNPEYSYQTPSREEIRASLGWQADLTTLLVVGGKRVRHLSGVLRALNHSRLPLQLVIVAGGDTKSYEALQAEQWHLPTHLYNFVDTLPQMMRAADCIACKAGGLIVSEALACGLPILLIDRIEGQESGNSDYVVQEKAGDLVLTPLDALETVFHWLDNNDRLLAERADSARRIGHPRSAYDVAELLWTVSKSPDQA